MKPVQNIRLGWPRRIAFLAFVLFPLLGWLTGCGGMRIITTNSLAPGREIIIDGKPDDWLGSLAYLQDEKILVGFLNDKDNLYLCIQAADRFRLLQILSRGLTVWFDPQGGQGKKSGIRFPLGVRPEDLMPLLDAGEARGEDAIPPDFQPEAMAEMEILKSPSGKGQVINLREAKGIEINASPWGGGIVVEFKIPLVQSPEHPYAVGAQPGAPLGVGFETLEMNFGRMPGIPRGGGTPRGGMRQPMGGMSGGMDGFNTRLNMPKPLKVWAVIRLSQADKQSPADIRSLLISK
jgi:hypothetical protein